MEQHLFALNANNLPHSFMNEIVEEKSSELEYHIRSSINDLDDIQKWVNQFSVQTKTQWIVRHSNPNGMQMKCMKYFVCHHSNFKKVDRETHRNGPTVSKNTYCPAKLIIKIKLISRNTARRDPFIKKNLPAIIRISKQHSHKLESAQTFRFLQDREKIQYNKFMNYFSSGMHPAEAKRYHEGLLKGNVSKVDLSNGFMNPSMATIRYWYSKWRSGNFNSQDGKGIIKKLSEVSIQDSLAEISLQNNPLFCDDKPSDSNGTDAPIIKKECEEGFNVCTTLNILNKAKSVCDLLLTKIETYHSSRTNDSIDVIHQQLTEINSEELLERFLCSAGSCFPDNPKSETQLRVQVTPVAQRRDSITRSARKIPACRTGGSSCGKKRKKE